MWLSLEYTTIVLYIISVSKGSSDLRRLYIAPDHLVNPQRYSVPCNDNHCYSLQDVINNKSYFFSSNTTLEFMPGRFEVTERIGQFIIANISFFSMMRYPMPWIDRNQTNAVIHCKPGAMFGFTFVNCSNVIVANLSLSNCSAKLSNTITKEIRILLWRRHFEINQHFWAWIRNSTNCETLHFPCLVTLISINSRLVQIDKVTIIQSMGIGLLGFANEDLEIVESLVAYNKFNCVIYLGFVMTNITGSQFIEGHGNDIALASGLNIFSDASRTSSSNNLNLNEIWLTNVILRDNEAQYGNFYLGIRSWDGHSNVTIKNLTSVVSKQVSIPLPGIVIDYSIYYEWSTYTNIQIDGGSFVGNCVNINGWKRWGSVDENNYFNLVLDHLNITGCKCPMALTVNNTERSSLHDIQITSSHNNIAYISNELSVIYFSNVKFSENHGTFLIDSGTVIFKNSTFFNNTAFQYDSVLLLRNSSKVSFPQVSYFTKNRAHIGGAISVHNSQLCFKIEAYSRKTLYGKLQHYFTGNMANIGGAISLTGKSVLNVTLTGMVFTGNKAQQYGGALYIDDSILSIQGRINFSRNSAKSGGAISLTKGSVIEMREKTEVSISYNSATHYGGGVYVDDAGLWEATSKHKCFVQSISAINYTIQFEYNKAEIAGSDLFGGWIDYCFPSGEQSVCHFLQFGEYDSDLSPVSSNPSRVCLCNNSIPDCSILVSDIELFPGQTFKIEIVAVGQRLGVIPATVRAEFEVRSYEIVDDLHKLQEGQKKCTILKYAIKSPNKEEAMLVTVDKHYLPNLNVNRGEKQTSVYNDLSLDDFRVIIHLKNCSLGFQFESKLNICVCHYDLVNRGIECNTTTHTVDRKGQQWISASTTKDRIVIHDHCPLDFCKAEHLSLNLTTPNDQCSFSHSGVLCGACQFGLSQVLGTSNCKKCSNVWLLITLPFALAGIVLVMCLTLLNLTVSIGTMNGLIFYANIIRANSATFFPGQSANTFLSWFIAWLNLDLGIETCFYNGLDAHAKTWLQFVFPLYVWFMVAAIIVSSHYSTRAGRIFGNNAVQVLATLFLLSYAKLLRTTITIFQPTVLVIPDDYNRLVWRYDGNIDHLQGKHLALFVTALLFLILLFIPYTLILFGIQWLQTVSHYKFFFWVNKLKPLLDAYAGPYKNKHRYWTGLLLLIRILLFTVFSANTVGDSAINLLAITITIVCLFVYLSFFGGIYKKWPLNLLEYTYLLNLALLSVGTLYILTTDQWIFTISQISVSIAIITMLFTVLHHCSASMCKTILKHMKTLSVTKVQVSEELDTVTKKESKVTSSVVELKESLL